MKLLQSLLSKTENFDFKVKSTLYTINSTYLKLKNLHTLGDVTELCTATMQQYCITDNFKKISLWYWHILNELCKEGTRNRPVLPFFKPRCFRVSIITSHSKSLHQLPQTLFYLPSRRKVIRSKYAKRKYFTCEYIWNVSKIGKCSERKKVEYKAAWKSHAKKLGWCYISANTYEN